MKNIRMWIGCMTLGCAGMVAASLTPLPFNEDFSALEPGTLHGQNGWTVSGEDALVNVGSWEGRSGVSLARTSGVEKELSSDGTAVWLRFEVWMTAHPDEDPAGPDPLSSVAFYVNSTGNLVVYNGETPFELADTIPAGEWVSFEVYCDYEDGFWNLEINGETVAHGLALYSEFGQTIGSIRFANEQESAVYLAFVEVKDTELVLDPEGPATLPVWWKQKFFPELDPNEVNPAEIVEGTGGLNRMEAYIAGIRPDNPRPFTVSRAGTQPGISWRAAAGRQYDVYWTDDLASGFELVREGLTADEGEEIVVADESPEEVAGFYRIRVRR